MDKHMDKSNEIRERLEISREILLNKTKDLSKGLDSIRKARLALWLLASTVDELDCANMSEAESDFFWQIDKAKNVLKKTLSL